MVFLAKKRRGSTVIEVAMTFPVLCYLMFFMLEMIKMNDVQTAVESISTEMAFEFMASRKTSKFTQILNKYKPPFVNENNIKWYFDMYTNLPEMCNNTLFGEIMWPDYSYQNSFSYGSNDYIDADRDNSFTPSINGKLALTDCKNPDAGIDYSGKPFVLTVVCNYPFQDNFTKMLFNGGKNTKGSKFLIWGRSVGVCS
jgi:hypothetical protein